MRNSAHATNGFVTDETSPDEFFRRLDNAEEDATNGLVTDESNSSCIKWTIICLDTMNLTRKR